MPALINNPKQTIVVFGIKTLLIIPVGVIMHQSQATMVLLTVQRSESTTLPDKHRQYALET